VLKLFCSPISLQALTKKVKK